MSKIILHAGRHKSGTTAIQQFLKSNSQLLQDRGYYYPKYGIRGYGHHDIASLLTRAAVRAAGKNLKHSWQQATESLQQEITEKTSSIIISSEALQNGDPADIRKFFGEHEYKVVFYIREQANYLLSAYAQKIHATGYAGSLEQFYRNDFVLNDYELFLQQWIEVFGENLVVRVYDRNELLESNVVFDFCHHVLEIDLHTLKQLYTPAKANPSLTRNLLTFKRNVNARAELTVQQQRDMYLGLSELSLSDNSGRISISQQLADEVRGRYRETNNRVAAEFFNRETLFRQPPLVDEQILEPTVAELSEIASQLALLRPGLADVLAIQSSV